MGITGACNIKRVAYNMQHKEILKIKSKIWGMIEKKGRRTSTVASESDTSPKIDDSW